jgi:hypothetical protein
MAPVDPKNTRGARDFFLMPTGIAIAAPRRENIHDLQAQKMNTLKFVNRLTGFVKHYTSLRLNIPLTLTLGFQFPKLSD